MNAQGKILSPIADDTVEIVLTAEEMQILEAAAETAEPPIVSSRRPPLPSGHIASQRGEDQQRRRRGWGPIAMIVGSTAAYAAFAWWGASILAERKEPTALVAARYPSAVLPRAAIPATPQLPVVQVRNPFDSTEVFEFPAGTTDADSRKKVSEILLQRARERRAGWARINPKVTLRTASLRTGKS